MLIVGLTGGIASGKSTVARMLEELGAKLVDTDQLAREAVAPGSPALAEIRAAFGKEVFFGDGSLDRARLRRVIFADPEARARLNAIVHPRVEELARESIAGIGREAPQAVVVVDVPLLYETGWEERVEAVILAYAPPQVQIGRLIARDGVGERVAQVSLAAQMPIEEKLTKAHFVVDNSGSLDETRFQAATVWNKLQAWTRSRHQRTSGPPAESW